MRVLRLLVSEVNIQVEAPTVTPPQPGTTTNPENRGVFPAICLGVVSRQTMARYLLLEPKICTCCASSHDVIYHLNLTESHLAAHRQLFL